MILVVFNKHLLLRGYFTEQRKLNLKFVRTLFQLHNKLSLMVLPTPGHTDEYHQSTSYLYHRPQDYSCYQDQG